MAREETSKKNVIIICSLTAVNMVVILFGILGTAVIVQEVDIVQNAGVHAVLFASGMFLIMLLLIYLTYRIIKKQ